MRNKRQIFHVNITAKQMKELEALVKRERQRLNREKPHDSELAAAMKGIQAALERSVYFFNKHQVDEDGRLAQR